MKVICGESTEVLKNYSDNHFDSVVTDPPYGIEFLNKDWDNNTGTVELWTEVYRVLRPGGHCLAFSAARTYHRLATNLEDVGFEIRDQLMWVYSSGFPKAQDVGKNIAKKEQGKKQFSLPESEWSKLQKIDGDIYELEGKHYRKLPMTKGDGAAKQYGGNKWAHTFEEVFEHNNEWSGWKTALKPGHEPIVMARKPMKQSTVKNVQEYGVGALNIDATRIPSENTEHEGRFPSNVIGEIDGYQKYFYCPKVNKKERHIGLHTGNKGNNHPTVKPIDLMAYLVRLVTPKGGIVLDPFCGSGSTGMACKQEGMNFTGIDLDQNYVDISRKRIDAWDKNPTKPLKQGQTGPEDGIKRMTFNQSEPQKYKNKPNTFDDIFKDGGE